MTPGRQDLRPVRKEDTTKPEIVRKRKTNLYDRSKTGHESLLLPLHVFLVIQDELNNFFEGDLDPTDSVCNIFPVYLCSKGWCF